MKTIFLFLALSCLMSDFSNATESTPDDQILGFVTDEWMGDSDEGITDFKKECAQINLEVKKRIAQYLSTTSEVDASSLNAKAVYSFDHEWIGMIGHPATRSERINVCTVYIRLTSSKKILKMKNSDVYYTGRGRVAACENLKTETDTNSSVLFSRLFKGLFRCSVKQIVTIENK